MAHGLGDLDGITDAQVEALVGAGLDSLHKVAAVRVLPAARKTGIPRARLLRWRRLAAFLRWDAGDPVVAREAVDDAGLEDENAFLAAPADTLLATLNAARRKRGEERRGRTELRAHRQALFDEVVRAGAPALLQSRRLDLLADDTVRQIRAVAAQGYSGEYAALLLRHLADGAPADASDAELAARVREGTRDPAEARRRQALLEIEAMNERRAWGWDTTTSLAAIPFVSLAAGRKLIEQGIGSIYEARLMDVDRVARATGLPAAELDRIRQAADLLCLPYVDRWRAFALVELGLYGAFRSYINNWVLGSAHAKGTFITLDPRRGADVTAARLELARSPDAQNRAFAGRLKKKQIPHAPYPEGDAYLGLAMQFGTHEHEFVLDVDPSAGEAGWTLARAVADELYRLTTPIVVPLPVLAVGGPDAVAGQTPEARVARVAAAPNAMASYTLAAGPRVAAFAAPHDRDALADGYGEGSVYGYQVSAELGRAVLRHLAPAAGLGVVADVGEHDDAVLREIPSPDRKGYAFPAVRVELGGSADLARAAADPDQRARLARALARGMLEGFGYVTARLRGRVVDEDTGKPVAGARVLLSDPNGWTRPYQNSNAEYASAVTGEQGAFVLEVPVRQEVVWMEGASSDDLLPNTFRARVAQDGRQGVELPEVVFHQRGLVHDFGEVVLPGSGGLYGIQAAEAQSGTGCCCPFWDIPSTGASPAQPPGNLPDQPPPREVPVEHPVSGTIPTGDRLYAMTTVLEHLLRPGTGFLRFGPPIVVSNLPEEVGSGAEAAAGPPNPPPFGPAEVHESGILVHTTRQDTPREAPYRERTFAQKLFHGPFNLYFCHRNLTRDAHGQNTRMWLVLYLTTPTAPSAEARITGSAVTATALPIVLGGGKSAWPFSGGKGTLPFEVAKRRVLGPADAGPAGGEAIDAAIPAKANGAVVWAGLVDRTKWAEGHIHVDPPAGLQLGVYFLAVSVPASAGAAPPPPTPAQIQAILCEERPAGGSSGACPPGTQKGLRVAGAHVRWDDAHFGRTAGVFDASQWDGAFLVDAPPLGRYLGLGINTVGSPHPESIATAETAQVPVAGYPEGSPRSYINYGTYFRCSLTVHNRAGGDEPDRTRYVRVRFAVFHDRTGKTTRGELPPPQTTLVGGSKVFGVSHWFNGVVRKRSPLPPPSFPDAVHEVFLTSEQQSVVLYDRVRLLPGDRFPFTVEFPVPGFASRSHGIVVETYADEEPPAAPVP